MERGGERKIGEGGNEGKERGKRREGKMRVKEGKKG